MNKIKIVVFDLDGTLINAYPAVYASVNATVKKFGYPTVKHQTIKQTVGWGDRHLVGTFVADKDLDVAMRFYRKHHALALRQDTKLLPGALKILKFLKAKGYKIAVASNRPNKFSLIAIKFLRIQRYFDMVLCADKVKKPKPAPDILNTILKRFSLKKSEAIFVGDMGIDIRTGKSARVKTIAVATGSNTASELQALKPYAVIKNVWDVKKFLL